VNLKRPASPPGAPRSYATALTTMTTLLGLLATFLAAGCSNDHQGDAKALQSREWRAVRIAGVTAVLPLAQGAATATFSDGRVTGSDTVNRFFGSYELEPGNAIRIFEIGSTEMAGPPDLLVVEAAYLATLPRVASYEIEGNVLWLRDAAGADLVRFTADQSFASGPRAAPHSAAYRGRLTADTWRRSSGTAWC
jgi:heat shock protein HslJ